jgi:hypothetical protein
MKLKNFDPCKTTQNQFSSGKPAHKAKVSEEKNNANEEHARFFGGRRREDRLGTATKAEFMNIQFR